MLATIGTTTMLGIAGCSEETDRDTPESESDGNGDESDGNGEAETEDRPVRTVAPGDSIQGAVDEIEPGGRVEVQEGTYTQSVTVDKELSLVAPDGAILDGVDAEGAAVMIAASGVKLEGFEISRYPVDAVQTDSQVGNVTISNVDLFDNAAAGIHVAGEAIDLSNVLAEDNGGAPIRTLASSDGEVTISAVEFNRCGGGLTVRGGKTVELDGLDALQNEGTGIRVTGEDVRGQTVTVSESSIIEQRSGDGIDISGTNGSDEVSVTNTEVIDNSQFGLDLTGDVVEVTGVKANGNGSADAGISITSSADGEVTVRDTTVERTEYYSSYSTTKSAHGIQITDGETVTVENVSLLQNHSGQLAIDAPNVRGQRVDISDSLVEAGKDGSGISVSGTNGTDEITVSDTQAVDNESRGMYLRGDIVEVTGVEATGNGTAEAGISIISSADGEVTVRDTTVERTEHYSSYSTNIPGHGIKVTDGKTVTVEGVSLRENYSDQLHLEAPNLRGQTVTVTDSTFEASESENGIYLAGTDGTDSHTIQNVEADDNDEYGLMLGGETVVIEDTSADGNGDGDLRLTTIDRSEATIRNSF